MEYTALFSSGSQAASIMSLQPSSLVHIASNIKRFLIGFLGYLCLRDKASRQWSEIDIEQWKTLASGNIDIHSSLATIRSRLSLVLWSPFRPLHHVNHCPIKPISTNPHQPKQFRNLSICFTSLSCPLHFSLGWTISLKSPNTIHDISHWAFNVSNNCHDI